MRKSSSIFISVLFLLSALILSACTGQQGKTYDPDHDDVNSAAKSLTDQGFSVMFQG